MRKTPAHNTLFYGDNLAMLRELAMIDAQPYKGGKKGGDGGVDGFLYIKPDGKKTPKIQIVTVEQLFGPSNPLHLPWQDTSVFKKAKREPTATQSKLDL